MFSPVVQWLFDVVDPKLFPFHINITYLLKHLKFAVFSRCIQSADCVTLILRRFRTVANRVRTMQITFYYGTSSIGLGKLYTGNT